MEFLNQVQLDQLVTAAGFIAYLIYQNHSMQKDIRNLVREKDEVTQKYIESLGDANKDLIEATRTFDRLLNARGQ